MAYIANTQLKFKLDDGTYCVVAPGGAIPSHFPDQQRTLAALQRARQITHVPDEAAPEFVLDLIPTKAEKPKVSPVVMEDVDTVIANVEAAQRDSAQRAAQRKGRRARN